MREMQNEAKRAAAFATAGRAGGSAGRSRVLVARNGDVTNEPTVPRLNASDLTSASSVEPCHLWFHSPRVRFRCFATWAGPDFVEFLECGFVELDVERAERAGELVHRARTDDR